MAGERALTGEMDHEEIRSELILDRYVTRKLSLADEARFEEHYLDCTSCQVELEATERFATALRAAERSEPLRGWRRLGRPVPLALLAASFLLPAALCLILLFELRETSGRLEALVAERAVKRLTPSASTASVFVMETTRSAGGPNPRLILNDPGDWVIFVLDRPDAVAGRRYRVSFVSAAGSRHGPFAAAESANGTLTVGVPPGALAAGEYQLELGDASSDGRTPIRRIRFHLEPRPRTP